MEEFNSIIDKKNEIFKNEILTENINKNKKYLDKINSDNIIENTIIADIIFKNKNINIVKSNKIKNELPKFNEFLCNDKLNSKYISYNNFYFPSSINSSNNKQIKVYMLSLINNIEEFYSINNSNNILYNMNQKYIKEKMYDNNNTSFSACNYFFIDYLFSFLFDIEKRRKNINKNNNNGEISQENKNEKIDPDDNKSEIPQSKPLLEDSFLNDCLLIIFEIIVELPKKEIIDYFLYKNNNISTKLKIFFQRNICFFNENNDFIQKLFQILSADEKSSVLEEEIRFNQQILLVILSEIFLDLLIFQKLNFNSQNIVLIKLSQLLFNNIIFNHESNLNNFLYILLEKLYNITLYYELSSKQINYSLDEENNTPLQIDIIGKCINTLLNIFLTNKNKEFEDKINDLHYNIYNLYLNFNENKQSHNIKNFFEENKIYFEYNFLNNDSINNQLQKIMNLISKYDMDRTGSKNNSFEIIYKKDLNNNENKICYFCLYIKNYFYIKFEDIYNNIKFDKIMDNNYINTFLNFEGYREILGINNFAWFLSRNESNHKIQNKFLLKKNDINRKSEMKKRLNGDSYTYEYIYDKEKYKTTIKSLFEILLLDKISSDFNLVNTILEKENKELNINNNSNIIENCLYIKTIHKTLSVMILLKEYILILTNICIDNNKKLNVVKSEIDGTIWCLQKEEYESELDQYISKNEKNIIKELFTDDGNNKKQKVKGFGYNNTYKFSFKKLYYKNISEMHRVSYLTVPNSIEIFMSNGKSYFLCFNITKREKMFMEIINNINEVYKIKEKRLEGYTDSFLKKSSKNVCFENFYMKYCPITYIENNIKEYSSTGLFGLKKSARKKTSSVHVSSSNLFTSNIKTLFNEAIINENTFRSEVIDLWAKNKISNFDYIMLLNILSGRSLNNLSQYFIFPRIFNDFNHNILNWISSSIYRDLSYPILASEPSLREDIKNKYDITEVDKYHSGTFYSTYAFISYFLIRQRPFSEISLEIQGGEFDATDRLFIGSKEICGMKEKYQESIPPLMTLPELYINFNKFYFGKTQKNEFFVNDFILPNWSKDDPRKFSLVIKRIFESRNVNAKLNKWIDLIFGIAQSGPEAVKFLNTYRKACYELSLDEIEELKKKFELLGLLIEKQELGYNAKQIFTKPHKKKENWNEYKEYENMFFDTNLKLRNIKFIKINNSEYDKEKNNIIFNSINDFLIDIDNEYIKNTNVNNNCQGGIASLKSIIAALSENNLNNFNQKYNNPLKIINILEKENKFIILGKGYHFLGKNYDYILCYKNKYLEIMNLKLDVYYSFYLNESDNISTLVTNDKGNKIYIAFNNGNIIEYKIHILEEDEYVNEIKKKKDNMIYPCIKSNTLDKISLKNKNYYVYNLNEDIFDKSITSLKRSETKKLKKKLKLPKISSPPIITLQKNMENNFSFNNPHTPEKIIKIKLNEENKILIALTVSNIIYIISLNNKFKLMHILTYYKNYKYQYKIKDIIPFPNNGDFLIYSSLTVHLFSINGVPLCELNLLEKVHECIANITYCRAIFLYDVILFTGHEDSSIIIWKVKNKNTLQNFNERVSYVYNNNKSKSFLNEYYYNYDFDIDDKNNNYNIQECELRRKFEIVSQIKMEENLNNISIDFMKMSQDMSYMIILDNKKDIYILSNFDDYKEENISSNSGSSTNLNMNNSTGVFGYFKDKKKIYCISCCKEVGDSYYRASRVQSLSNIQSESNDYNNNSIACEEDLYSTKVDDTISSGSNLDNSEKDENKNNNKETKDINYICEECKLKLINTESYLYNY